MRRCSKMRRGPRVSYQGFRRGGGGAQKTSRARLCFWLARRVRMLGVRCLLLMEDGWDGRSELNEQLNIEMGTSFVSCVVTLSCFNHQKPFELGIAFVPISDTSYSLLISASHGPLRSMPSAL